MNHLNNQTDIFHTTCLTQHLRKFCFPAEIKFFQKILLNHFNSPGVIKVLQQFYSAAWFRWRSFRCICLICMINKYEIWILTNIYEILEQSFSKNLKIVEKIIFIQLPWKCFIILHFNFWSKDYFKIMKILCKNVGAPRYFRKVRRAPR